MKLKSTSLFLVTILMSKVNETISKFVHLNESNWDEATKGNSVFIKFCSKTCSHCQQMKAAWAVLEETWEEDERALIGTVDCDINMKLCEIHDVVGTPTLLYGDRNNLEEYAGETSLYALNNWAKLVLVPICSPENTEPCNDTDRERLKKWMSMTVEDVQQMIENMKQAEIQAEIDFDNHMQVLQVQYDEMNSVYVMKTAAIKREIDFMKSIEVSRKVN